MLTIILGNYTIVGSWGTNCRLASPLIFAVASVAAAPITSFALAL